MHKYLATVLSFPFSLSHCLWP